MKLWYLVVWAGLMLASCTDTAPQRDGDILVLGDSVMTWNGRQDASIADAIEQALDRRVVSRAVPGAQIDNASALAGAVGYDIRRQYRSGRWNWIVVNGGANDLSADCGCTPCSGTVDALIAPDAARGAIPDFIRKLRNEAGANVLWMGYYAGSGTGPFAGCRADLVEIEARIAAFAARTQGVHFADAEDVIDRGNRSLFAADNVHPSATGSAVIGAYLAAQIRRREARSQTLR